MNYEYSQESILILTYYVPLKEIFHPKVRWSKRKVLVTFLKKDKLIFFILMWIWFPYVRFCHLL